VWVAPWGDLATCLGPTSTVLKCDVCHTPEMVPRLAHTCMISQHLVQHVSHVIEALTMPIACAIGMSDMLTRGLLRAQQYMTGCLHVQ
jgi:hypothetical protein